VSAGRRRRAVPAPAGRRRPRCPPWCRCQEAGGLCGRGGGGRGGALRDALGAAGPRGSGGSGLSAPGCARPRTAGWRPRAARGAQKGPSPVTRGAAARQAGSGRRAPKREKRAEATSSLRRFSHALPIPLKRQPSRSSAEIDKAKGVWRADAARPRQAALRGHGRGCSTILRCDERFHELNVEGASWVALGSWLLACRLPLCDYIVGHGALSCLARGPGAPAAR
jgi:hypothetical protein